MVTIFKDGMRLRIRPLTPTVRRVLTDNLCYLKKRYLPTRALQEQFGSDNNPYFEFTRVQCYGIGEYAGRPQMFTNAGFLRRIKAALDGDRIDFKVIDKTPAKAMYFEEPNWDVLKEYEMRPRQEDALRTMLKMERGRLIWATGTGKSVMIEMICRLLAKSRIVITTRYNDTLDTIYDYLKSSVSGCGLYSSRTKKPGRRVTCVSAGCLKYALTTLRPQVVICDEVHELATPSTLEHLSLFKYARMFGLTANEDDRLDGADFELLGVFGQVADRLNYSEGVKHGMIVPIEVHWRKVKMKKNPVDGKSAGVPKSRWGIWRNKVRNKMIAEDARFFPDDQVLITVATVEHAVYLKKHLPEFTMVYGAVDDKDIPFYVNHGLLPENYKPLTRHDRTSLRQRFERGKLRKVIATTVWNRGVNFRKLGVLIRAAGGSSTIDSTQVPGRLSRICKETGKKAGLLIDYKDGFDSGLDRRSNSRGKDYGKHKWKQIKEGQEGHFRSIKRGKAVASKPSKDNDKARKSGVHILPPNPRVGSDGRGKVVHTKSKVGRR